MNSKIKKNKQGLRKEYLRLWNYQRLNQPKKMLNSALQLELNFNRFMVMMGLIGSKVGGYIPLSSEIPLDQFSAIRRGLFFWFVPQIFGSSMLFQESKGKRLIEPGWLDWVIVPGRFVTHAGYRLGRGAGYYDRSLRYLPRTRTVFICFDWQILKQLPVDPWDRQIGWIVSDKQIISV